MAGKAGSVMPISVTTARLVNVLKSRVARNPIRSMRAMAHDIRVSEVMVRKVIKERLGARSLARTHNFLLTDHLKGLRLERSKKLLNIFKK